MLFGCNCGRDWVFRLLLLFVTGVGLGVVNVRGVGVVWLGLVGFRSFLEQCSKYRMVFKWCWFGRFHWDVVGLFCNWVLSLGVWVRVGWGVVRVRVVGVVLHHSIWSEVPT